MYRLRPRRVFTSTHPHLHVYLVCHQYINLRNVLGTNHMFLGRSILSRMARCCAIRNDLTPDSVHYNEKALQTRTECKSSCWFLLYLDSYTKNMIYDSKVSGQCIASHRNSKGMSRGIVSGCEHSNAATRFAQSKRRSSRASYSKGSKSGNRTCRHRRRFV